MAVRSYCRTSTTVAAGRTISVQYQGFRQVLGTTQVLPVPTAAERAGLDTTDIFRRSTDTLIVRSIPRLPQCWPAIHCPTILRAHYGARTYAAPSKVNTDRRPVLDSHRSEARRKAQFFGRFNLRQSDGANDQSRSDIALIRPSASNIVDRQRNWC